LGEEINGEKAVELGLAVPAVVVAGQPPPDIVVHGHGGAR